MTETELRSKVDQLHSDLGFIKKLGIALVGALFSLAGVGVFALVQIGAYKERVDTMQVQMRRVRDDSRSMRNSISTIRLELAVMRPAASWLTAPMPSLRDPAKRDSED